MSFYPARSRSMLPDLPDMVMTREISHRIGMLALMSNEHDSNPSRASSLPWSEAWLEQMICDFIPITEANELRFDFASVPRMHKIVNYLAPARVTHPAYFDVGALFEKASGLPLKLFEALTLFCMEKFESSVFWTIYKSLPDRER